MMMITFLKRKPKDNVHAKEMAQYNKASAESKQTGEVYAIRIDDRNRQANIALANSGYAVIIECLAHGNCQIEAYLKIDREAKGLTVEATRSHASQVLLPAFSSFAPFLRVLVARSFIF